MRQIGGFPQQVPHATDVAVWARLAIGGTIGHMPQPLAHYRIQFVGGNITSLAPIEELLIGDIELLIRA